MADLLTLLNKRNDKINVFVVPLGMIPIEGYGDNKNTCGRSIQNTQS